MNTALVIASLVGVVATIIGFIVNSEPVVLVGIILISPAYLACVLAIFNIIDIPLKKRVRR